MQITNTHRTRWSENPARWTGGRHFGGFDTPQRRANGIAYAWREHRRSGRPEPYFFTVVKTKGPADGTLIRPEVPRALRRRAAAAGSYRPSMVVGFVTRADRERGIKHLTDMGYNHFTLFRDAHAFYALMVGHAGSWLAPGAVWVNR